MKRIWENKRENDIKNLENDIKKKKCIFWL